MVARGGPGGWGAGGAPLAAVAALALVGSALLTAPAPLAAQAAAWVGCWALDHREDWAPSVNRDGFPTGSQAPAPRTVLLDRLPGLRSNLQGAPGASTLRAEWVGRELRGTETWALRPDGNVYLESAGGPRVLSLLLDGPPSEGVAPGSWFFLRTDTPIPEIRSLVTARRVSCPEGRGPHREVRDEAVTEVLTEALGEAAARAAFLRYDGLAREIVRGGEGTDAGLIVPGASGRSTAWVQAGRLVDQARRTPGEADLAHAEGRRLHGVSLEEGTAWAAGVRMVPGEGDTRHPQGWVLHLHELPAAWVERGEEGVAEGLWEVVGRVPSVGAGGG
jgi:hypothetical protein